MQSEDLPHSSGIKTHLAGSFCIPTDGRKTCPTNRGLRLDDVLLRSEAFASEDLPHKSGIKTICATYKTLFGYVGRLAPTNRGLRLNLFLSVI